jgi:hypothetical protein
MKLECAYCGKTWEYADCVTSSAIQKNHFRDCVPFWKFGGVNTSANAAAAKRARLGLATPVGAGKEPTRVMIESTMACVVTVG